MCDRLRPEIAATVFLNMFKNLFATDFNRETVHDHHDLCAILCDLADQLVVHRSQPGRKAMCDRVLRTFYSHCNFGRVIAN